MPSVIEYQDPTGEIMVARVPPQGTGEFVTGSQLIVQDGQIAVFFRDGRSTDAFRAGRFTLSTENLPVITKLLNLPVYGLKSPFRAYVYFLHLKTFTNLGWGTSTPVLFHDEKYGDVPFRANGSFSIRLGNPSVFLRTIVGSKGLETTYAVELFVRDVVLSSFAMVLPTRLTTVTKLPMHYKEIAASLKKAVFDDLNQYGLELVDLIVGAITLPEEVQAAISRAAASRALDQGELQRYQSIAAADALRDAAQQPGGGTMAEGLSLGAGMAMAQQFTAGQRAPQAGPPPLPGPSAVQWYVGSGGKRAGPFTEDQMRQYILAAKVKPTTMVWREGMDNWAAAGQVPDLAPLFASVPPPPPPA